MAMQNKRIVPARRAGLVPRFNDRPDWSKRLVPFRVWDQVNAKVDARHVGEVICVVGNSVKVRWPSGWISEFRADELEKM